MSILATRGNLFSVYDLMPWLLNARLRSLMELVILALIPLHVRLKMLGLGHDCTLMTELLLW